MGEKTKILVIDDENDMLTLLHRILSSQSHYEVTTSNDPKKAINLIEKHKYQVIITDLKMPNIDGMQILEIAKSKNPEVAVIMITAYGTIESAVEATKKGAFDYITKPFRKDRILQVMEQAIKWQKVREENSYLKKELMEKSGYPSLLGHSPIMLKLKEQIAKVAKTTVTVLITGESGTGKELVARSIHAQSSRSDKPFVPINCSAIPEHIMESEFFGHVKGSFTGAIKDKKGVVEEANGGTLFLDEIGDLPLGLQAKLLRLLQEGEYKPVGSNNIKKVDVRYIAATNQNLEEKIQKGEFREDLYYRLNVINIHIPPLRERKEDIPLLVNHFIKKYNIIHGKAITSVTEEAMEAMLNYHWPGNVRELQNTIERGIIMAAKDILTIDDIFHSNTSILPSTKKNDFESLFDLPFKEAKEKILTEFQTRYLLKFLTKNDGNITRTAEECGLKRQYIYKLLKKANIDHRFLR